MSKRRFSTLSVVVMITVTALLTWLNLRMSWGWAGGCGFPFQWYTYKDFATPSSPAQQYHYLSFLADIAIALAIVAVVGMLIERMSTRHRHERCSVLAAPTTTRTHSFGVRSFAPSRRSARIVRD